MSVFVRPQAPHPVAPALSAELWRRAIVACLGCADERIKSCELDAKTDLIEADPPLTDAEMDQLEALFSEIVRAVLDMHATYVQRVRDWIAERHVQRGTAPHDRQHSSLNVEQIQRAKSRAAVASVTVYVETLERAMLEVDDTCLSDFVGMQLHEAVVVDDSGRAVVLRCIWELLSSPDEVVEVLKRASPSPTEGAS